MPRQLTQPTPLRPGDKVAVLSPGWCAPAHFPEVHAQALQRVRDVLGLEPVEFPTTRRQGTSQERAADVNAAFADESIRGILATIGGDDQITILRHLDPAVAQRDPKPFAGYSDNTNLLNWLWFHGVAGVHGGSTQVHLGPGPRVDEPHLETLRAALFGGEVELRSMERTRDGGIDWADPRALTDVPDDEPAEPWTWFGPAQVVSAPTWGGNLEILQWSLAAGRWILPNEAYAGCVLMLETSEELPPPVEVYRMLRNMGERGLLEVFPALVWARPMASHGEVRRQPDEARAWRVAHRDAVLRAVREYNPEMVVVLDVDFGHTSPQSVLPYGGRLTVDAEQRKIIAHFG